jgi:transcriptional regulator with XRE-family HTH domain
MTQRDMAGFLGVTPMTLRNWRKDKPNLYKIIMQGFAFEEAVDKARQNYESLKEVQEKAKK